MNNAKKNFKGFIITDSFIILVVFFVALLGFFIGERSAIFGQLGDEVQYYLVAKDFHYALFERGLSDYQVQRILPSAIVHYALKAFNAEANVSNVVAAFGIVHIGLVTLMGYLWCLVARELKLSFIGKWLGAMVLFCNFAILKYLPYIQVTTDIFAYAAGLALAYYYLRNNVLGLTVTTLLGAFAWPTVVYAGAILILFPRAEQQVSLPQKNYREILSYGIVFLVVLFVFRQLPEILTELRTGEAFKVGVFTTGTNKPLMPFIMLSSGIAVVYIFTVVSRLLNRQDFFDIKYLAKQFSFARVCMAAGLVVSIKFFVGFLAHTHSALDISYVAKNMVILSLMQPAGFFVSHAIYFGPAIILLALFWNRFCRTVQGFGLGLVLIALMFGVVALHSESRLLMNFYPILVPFLIKSLDDIPWARGQVAAVFIISLISSKIWLKIHSGPWEGPIWEFPKQYYFMNFGPWMSHQMYVAQGLFVVAAAGVLWAVVSRRREKLPNG